MILTSYQIDLLIKSLEIASKSGELKCGEDSLRMLSMALSNEQKHINNTAGNKFISGDKFMAFMKNCGYFCVSDYTFMYNYPEDLVELTIDGDSYLIRTTDGLLACMDDICSEDHSIPRLEICATCGKPFHTNTDDNTFCPECFYELLDNEFNESYTNITVADNRDTQE